jgi:hypothetical protein
MSDHNETELHGIEVTTMGTMALAEFDHGPPAFRAAYADLKVIRTRQMVQLVFEVPIGEFDAAYEVLGGLPDSATERWFGIAAINRVIS